MIAAANLIALGSYPDRLRMFAALSDHLDRLWLLTDALPDDHAALTARHPHLAFVPLGARRFARRACDWIHRRADALDVVHDTFGHLAEVFEAHGPDPRRRLRLLTTLYTSNAAWFDRVRHRPYALGRRYVAQRIITRWRDLRLCPHADQVVVLGPGHAAALASIGVDPARVTWIPSEVDLDAFTPAPHPLVEPGPRLLYTGTVWRNKGCDLLIDVAPALVAAHPGLELHLVGPVVPWERPWLARALAQSPARAHLHAPGRRPRAELVDRYRQSDLYVFPSLFEGSPRSLREALACGLRAVASDIPGNRGVDPRGDFVRFVPPDDRPAWTAAILELLAEPPAAAAARVERARAHLRAHHSPAAVAARYAALYRRLCADPPSR